MLEAQKVCMRHNQQFSFGNRLLVPGTCNTPFLIASASVLRQLSLTSNSWFIPLGCNAVKFCCFETIEHVLKVHDVAELLQRNVKGWMCLNPITHCTKAVASLSMG